MTRPPRNLFHLAAGALSVLAVLLFIIALNKGFPSPHAAAGAFALMTSLAIQITLIKRADHE